VAGGPLGCELSPGVIAAAVSSLVGSPVLRKLKLLREPNAFGAPPWSWQLLRERATWRPLFNDRHVEILCAALIPHALTPPARLGLLRQGFLSGRAARGSAAPRKMACRPAVTVALRSKAIDSR